ncbi:MAG: outer membrane beta-barrel protein, partial [Bacteroidales bacterium]|nr:outer membrane beta-barrel protein [Bacteroidales bacterium]
NVIPHDSIIKSKEKKITFGINGNFSNSYLIFGIAGKRTLSYAFGGSCNYKISCRFELEAGILYSIRNYFRKDKSPWEYTDYDYLLRNSDIEIPICIRFNFRKPVHKIIPFIQTGIMPAFLVGGKLKYINYATQRYSIFKPNDDMIFSANYDFSILSGFGTKIKIKDKTIIIGLMGQLGLKSIFMKFPYGLYPATDFKYPGYTWHRYNTISLNLAYLL